MTLILHQCHVEERSFRYAARICACERVAPVHVVGDRLGVANAAVDPAGSLDRFEPLDHAEERNNPCMLLGHVSGAEHCH
jgi:hypothetical protein